MITRLKNTHPLNNTISVQAKVMPYLSGTRRGIWSAKDVDGSSICCRIGDVSTWLEHGISVCSRNIVLHLSDVSGVFFKAFVRFNVFKRQDTYHCSIAPNFFFMRLLWKLTSSLENSWVGENALIRAASHLTKESYKVVETSRTSRECLIWYLNIGFDGMKLSNITACSSPCS